MTRRPEPRDTLKRGRSAIRAEPYLYLTDARQGIGHGHNFDTINQAITANTRCCRVPEQMLAESGWPSKSPATRGFFLSVLGQDGTQRRAAWQGGARRGASAFDSATKLV